MSLSYYFLQTRQVYRVVNPSKNSYIATSFSWFSLLCVCYTFHIHTFYSDTLRFKSSCSIWAQIRCWEIARPMLTSTVIYLYHGVNRFLPMTVLLQFMNKSICNLQHGVNLHMWSLSVTDECDNTTVIWNFSFPLYPYTSGNKGKLRICLWGGTLLCEPNSIEVQN